jgi:hypothetical protein
VGSVTLYGADNSFVVGAEGNSAAESGRLAGCVDDLLSLEPEAESR